MSRGEMSVQGAAYIRDSLTNFKLGSKVFDKYNRSRVSVTYKLEFARAPRQNNDIQHNDTQHNDTQHNDIQHNDTQHNVIQHNDI